MRKYIPIIFALVVFTTNSCKKEVAPKNSSCTLELLNPSSTFGYGDTLLLKYSITKGDYYYFEHFLMANNNQITLNYLSKTYKLLTTDFSIGNHTITYFIKYQGNKISESSITFNLTSSLPVLKTVFYNMVSNDSIVFKTKVLTAGSSSTQFGLCYNTSSNPTIENNKIEVKEKYKVNDTFQIQLKGLKTLSTYYARAFAKNESGVTYGEEYTIKTPDITGTFTDTRDQKKYRWVKIGSQTWMAENLAWEGDGVKVILQYEKLMYDDSYWQENTNLCCYLYGDKSTYEKYGLFYQWDAAKNSCPIGWHLPIPTESAELINYLGGYAIAGKKLKSNYEWKNNGNGTNESGFDCKPVGRRGNLGGFSFTEPYFSKYGYFWLDEDSSFYVSNNLLNYDSNSVNLVKFKFIKNCGFSVRCIKDN